MLFSLHRGLRQLLPSGTSPSTPMANTQRCNDSNHLYAGVRSCSLSLFQSFTLRKTQKFPVPVICNVVLSFSYLCNDISSAYHVTLLGRYPRQHLNLNAVSSPSWWSRRRYHLRSLPLHRLVVPRPGENMLYASKLRVCYANA